MRLPAPLFAVAAAVLVTVGAGCDSDEEDISGDGTSKTMSDHISLEGVSDQLLTELGIELLPPTQGDEPAVTADEAEAIARGNGPAYEEVREVVLAHIHDSATITEEGQLVWVVNFEVEGEPAPPHSGPIGAEPDEDEDIVLLVSLSVVDATSGEWMYQAETSGPAED